MTLSILFFACVIATALDLASVAMVSAFIYQKPTVWQLVKTIVTPLLICIATIYLGLALGNHLTGILKPTDCNWIASSLFFMLALKMAYDALRLSQLKQTINPTSVVGLIVLAVFAGVNALFYSIAFGLLAQQQSMLNVAYFLVLGLIVGSIIGLRANRLYRLFAEWILAFVSLVSALVLIMGGY